MNSQTHWRRIIALAAFGVLATASARASLPTDWDGATIGFQYLFPNTGTVDEDDGVVVVGAGVEGDYVGVFAYDISGSQIVLSNFGYVGIWTSYSGTTFNGPHFFDAGLDDLDLTGVSVNPASTMAGLSNANLTWDGDNIFLNWQGLTFIPETQVILDLQFGGEQSVPEASTWAAGGAMALVAGGMWLRRRRA